MKRTFNQRQDASDSSDDEEKQLQHIYFSKEEVAKQGFTYINMPKKSLHRTHAHINPFNPLSIAHPKNPSFVDWSQHYPVAYGLPNPGKVVVNTKKYPVEGNYKSLPDTSLTLKTPQILDIGCGYGGLMFQLIKGFPDKLILGLEIRETVADYVGLKI
jgi:tRNA (guanine-N7-)-methyltransferase